MQNIVTPLAGDEVYVMTVAPYPWALNIKVPPIDTYLFVFSNRKLDWEQMMSAIRATR